MIRVAHLTSVHPADDIRIRGKECATLANAGYMVFLIASSDALAPSEVIDGVHLVRVPRRRGRLQRATRSAWSVFRATLQTHATVCHLHDPELIWVGILLKVAGRKVIYDVHEDLPRQIRDKNWIHPLLRAPIGRVAAVIESMAARLFDATVVVTPTIASRFPRASTVLIRNLPIIAELASTGGQRAYAARAPLAVYVGGIASTRGARQLVEAMHFVRRHVRARIVLAGRFQPEGLRDDLSQIAGWDRVDVAGWLGRSDVAELLGSARIGLVTLLPTASYLTSYPTKLFEYMAAGLPVVASDFPVWREIVESADCGLLVDPRDPRAIADAIERLLDDPGEAEAMGERGRAAVMERYSWEAEKSVLLELYLHLAGPPGVGGQ